MQINIGFNYKTALWLLGGIAIGAIGAVAVSRGKLDLKPFAAGVLSRGMDVKEAIGRKVAAVKEDLEDLAAEARAAQEQRHRADAGKA